MSDRAPAAQPQKEQEWLPPGPPPIVWEGFAGVNTSSSRDGIKDEQLWWCDGFMPLGPNYLRTMPGLAAAVFAAPGGTTIPLFRPFAAADTNGLLVFPTDGSIWAVVINVGVVPPVAVSSSQIAAPGTITAPSRASIDTCQWGSQYILIVSSNNANGYWAWDGTTFYPPGATLPGALGTMPTGITGNRITSYANRAWIAFDSSIEFSAPGSFNDFATADGGGQFNSTDPNLFFIYQALLSLTGFLFLVSDCAVFYISGVQTSGTPVTTTFTYQNADADTGASWDHTTVAWGSRFISGTWGGVYQASGGSMQKISEPMDAVLGNQLFGSGGTEIAPSICKATVFGQKILCYLYSITRPTDGVLVNLIVCWDGKAWWTTPQDVSLDFIDSIETFTKFIPFGTDGVNIYPLLVVPSTAFTKTAMSRLWDKNGGLPEVKVSGRLWCAARYFGAGSPNLSVSIDNEAGISSLPATLTPAGGFYTGYGSVTTVFGPIAISQNGVFLGMTLTTNAADVSLVKLSIDSKPWSYRG